MDREIRQTEEKILGELCQKHGLPTHMISGLLSLERSQHRFMKKAVAEAVRDTIAAQSCQRHAQKKKICNSIGSPGDWENNLTSTTTKIDGNTTEQPRAEYQRERGGIRLREIQLRNFSLFANAEVGFQFDPNRPICLIEGGNGHGKSTLLDATRFALYGVPSKSVAGLLHQDAQRPDARMEVQLRLLLVEDNTEVTVRRFVDFEYIGGKWNPRRSTFVVKPKNEESSVDEEASSWIDNRFPSYVADYFLFDAESSPVNALSADNIGDDVAGAMEAILGITPLRKLAKRLREFKNAIEREIQAESDLPSVRQAKAKLDSVEADLEKENERLAQLARQVSDIDKQKQNVARELDGLLKQFDPGEDQLRSSRQVKAESLKKEADEITKDLAHAVGETLPLQILNEHIHYAVNIARRARHEDEEAAWLRGATDATRRVAKLATAGDIPWNEEPMPTADEIAERLKRLLDLGGSDISETRFELSESSAAALETLARQASSEPVPARRVRDLLRIRKELSTMEAGSVTTRQGSDERGEDAEQSSLRTRYHRLNATKEDLAIQLDRLERNQKESRHRREALERVLGETKDKLNEAKTTEDTLSQKRQVSDLAARAASCTEECAERFRALRVERLENGATAMFRSITNKPELYDKVAFDPQTLRYKILDMDGKPAPEGRSTGEKAVLALAVVHGLQQASGLCLPLMVEAPFKPLDPEHTMKVLQEFYCAHHYGQVMMLTKPEEIPTGLRSSIAGRIGQHLFLERPHPEREESRIREVPLPY